MDIREVTLAEVLNGREQRVRRRNALLHSSGLPVVSFSLNIPGPVKRTPLVQRSFYEGLRMLQSRLPGKIEKQQRFFGVTGCEALLAVRMDALELKKLCVSIEEGFALGRLFDMDVTDADGRSVPRESAGGTERGCFVCGAPGRGCASRRVHSAEELQSAVKKRMETHFAQKDSAYIGAAAQEALLSEVCITPKPGLVDRSNSGSHKDMDIFSFMSGAAFLGDYFARCARTGMETADLSSEECFRRLRFLGIDAERSMYEATGGVNTHKGAVFSLGLFCGAAGRLWKPWGGMEEASLFAETAALAQYAGENELRRLSPDTAGLRLYRQLGSGGVRMEAAAGFPHVRNTALPAYRAFLAQGLDKNRAGCLTLLKLLAETEDTNMLARGGAEGAAEGRALSQRLLSQKELPSEEDIRALDALFIEKNLSPGGCADLLAAALLVSTLSEHFSEVKRLSEQEG